jgi:hypothetical protein
MTRPTRQRLPLAMLLTVSIGVGAAAAACGGPPSGGPQLPGNPTDTSSTSVTPPSSSGATTTPSTSSSTPTTASSSPANPPAFTGPMKPPTTTAMEAELKAAGLDVRKLVPMAKLDPKVLRGKVMPLFKKALGTECTGCHVDGDFAASTPNKKIATKMWDEFVVKFQLADKSALFCDSCHQGRMLELDRKDNKALSTWMQQNFVDKLALKTGKDHDCATCHGDITAPPFLKDWAK